MITHFSSLSNTHRRSPVIFTPKRPIVIYYHCISTVTSVSELFTHKLAYSHTPLCAGKLGKVLRETVLVAPRNFLLTRTVFTRFNGCSVKSCFFQKTKKQKKHILMGTLSLCFWCRTFPILSGKGLWLKDMIYDSTFNKYYTKNC